MTGQPTAQERLHQFVDFFLDPTHNVAGRWPETLTLLRDAALGDGPAPIVLPRLTEDEKFRLYVIARSPQNTTQVRDLLAAFVGASFAARGDTSPARLDDRDPVDRRVSDKFGPNSTFIVRVDTTPARKRLREAAELMIRAVNAAPHRDWTTPRSLSRLLADFEAALLGGSPQTAEALLEQIAHRGGLSPANLIGLRVKLLSVCGQDTDLLALTGLDRALLLDPPREVKEHVLAAVYGVMVGPVLESEDLAGAARALADPRVPRNLPTAEDPLRHGDAAVAVLLVALHGQGETARLAKAVRMLDTAGRGEAIPAVIRSVVDAQGAKIAEASLPGSPTERVELNVQQAPSPAEKSGSQESEEESAPALPLESWADLIEAVVEGERAAYDRARAVDAGSDEGWPVNAADDVRIAGCLSTCGDEQYERLWHIAFAPFLKGLLDSRESMPKTMEQIIVSSAGHRRDPTGLTVLGLLLTLALRSAPSASEYRELLEHVALMADQWVCPETAEQALDYVDLLLAYASPDADARAECAMELLVPLVGRAVRLGPALLDVARSLTDELELGDLGWPAIDKQQSQKPALSQAKALIYGLDTKVLSRVKQLTEKQYPQVSVTTASDKVGSSALRQKVRGADLIVMITQCATHAATGFIGQHAKRGSDIVYPDGGGSASAYRALVRALTPEQEEDAEA
ncbi:protein DpdD [Streptomyces phytophilus]|uniref:protein DpdD n=1 Tax=Streptomyces phytophilus TaxID=722715 RepID=UPI0015F0DC92|nr:protein DpdD [Streptomyces phytophilus]